MATVVHLKRKNGVEIVGCDVYIGRAMFQGGWKLPTSKWANPYKLSQFDRATVLSKYRDYVRSKPDLMATLHELRGKRLGCWCVEPRCLTCSAERGSCAHLQCHGDVLIELLRESENAQAEITEAVSAQTVTDEEIMELFGIG